MDKPTFLRIAREMRALQIEWNETERKRKRLGLLYERIAAEKRFDLALEELGRFLDRRGLHEREDS